MIENMKKHRAKQYYQHVNHLFLHAHFYLFRDHISVAQVRPGLFYVQGQLRLKVTKQNVQNDSNNGASNSASQTASKEESLERECNIDFAMDEQPYALKATFAKSNYNLMSVLSLIKATSLPNPSPAKKAKTTTSDIQMTSADMKVLYVYASVKNYKAIITLQKTSSDEWASLPFAFQTDLISSYWVREALKKKFEVSLWIDFGSPDSRAESLQLRKMSNLFANQILCDVTFELSKKESIGAHVAILSAVSPVFAAMFNHDVQEAKSRMVNIVDIEPEVFKQLLSFTYNGKVEVADLNNGNIAQKLLVAADKYGIEELKLQCELRLKSLVSIENVLDILLLAERYCCQKLYRTTLEFAANQCKYICFIQPRWKELVYEHPSICLELTQRMANEFQSSNSEKK